MKQFDYRQWLQELKTIKEDHAVIVLELHDKNTHNDAIEEAAIKAAGRAVMADVETNVAKEIAEEVLRLIKS